MERHPESVHQQMAFAATSLNARAKAEGAAARASQSLGVARDFVTQWRCCTEFVPSGHRGTFNTLNAVSSALLAAAAGPFIAANFSDNL